MDQQETKNIRSVCPSLSKVSMVKHNADPFDFALGPSYDPANASSSVVTVFIFTTAMTAINCHLVILFNALKLLLWQ